MRSRRTITVVGCHAGGEIGNVVVDGVPPPPGESVFEQMQALQREGYIAGITSRDFMQALRSGQHGKVAVTYFEWAGPYDQKIVVPWRLIDGPEAADARRRRATERSPPAAASRSRISCFTSRASSVPI